MKGKKSLVTMLTLGLMLALMASLGIAQEPAPQDVTAPQEIVSRAFTYQGRLKDASGPVNSTCDFQFSLWDALSSGTQEGATQTKTNVTVSEGLFTTLVNEGGEFGSEVFTGEARWLKIAVRCPAGGGTYTPLNPRQALTAAPYAQSLRPGAIIHDASFGYAAALTLRSNSGSGLAVGSAGEDGVYVSSTGEDGLAVLWAGDDGVYVNLAGNPSAAYPHAAKNGFEVGGAEGYGLYVGQADLDGVYVNSAYDGLRVASASWDGVVVDSAAASGLYVASTGGDGVYINQAGDDGVYVDRAGNPTNTFPQTGKNGFEVAGTEAVGLQVGRADIYGVWVTSAGYTGVGVTAAGTDGMSVYQAGNASTTVSSSANNGFEVDGAEGYGLYVGQADLDGVYVNSTTWDGVRVASAGWDGMVVDSATASGLYVGSTGGDGVNVNLAGDDGVFVYRSGSPTFSNDSSAKNGFEVAGAQGNGLYIGYADESGVLVDSAGQYGVAVISAADIGAYANTTQATYEWGFYTPDKIYAGVTLASGGPLMLVAQSGDQDNLEMGDVVSVSGMGAVFAEGKAPVPLVQRAGSGNSIMGVVYSRFVAEEEVREVELEGQVEQQAGLIARSADGPVAPGDYLLVVVMGAAQVKAEAVSKGILPGALLAASTTGQATNIAPAEINGLAYYPPGSVLGTAMEPLDVSRGSGLIWVLVNPR